MAPMYPLPTTTLPVVMPMLPPMVPKMVNGVPNGSVSLGASLRLTAAFSLQSPLRLPISAAIASRLRSLRSLRASLARRLAAFLHSPTCADATRSLLRSTASVRRTSPCPPARARRCAPRSSPCSPALAPGRNCAGCGHRLGTVAAALRALPVPASPRTALRTTPCSRARTGAGTTASASGRAARHSIAVAAPLRRLRRRRFPLRSSPDSWLSLRPSAFRVHTRRI